MTEPSTEPVDPATITRPAQVPGGGEQEQCSPLDDPKIKYEAKFRVDLGSAIPAIGDLMNRLNDGISSAGYNEKLSLTHDGIIPPMIVTVNRELTKGEQHKLKTLIEAQVISAFPKYDVRLTSFRRQSGNVLQSVS